MRQIDPPDYCEACQVLAAIIWWQPQNHEWLCSGCYMASVEDFVRVSR